MFERAGISTTCLSSCLDISERTRPPRTAFLNYPLGNQCGPPGEPSLQTQIVAAALRLLESVETPGEIVSLPFEWPDSHWQSEVRTRYEREAQVVTRQRLASEYDDSGHNYAAQECVDVCSLI